MDRHDVSESVTAEIVAEIHQEDLKIQNQFGCRGLTYWFDEKRKTAFCLIEAPNKKSIKKMHNLAHGEVPHQIIEVDANIVESFLGRIEDPQKAQNTRLNIINEPAFRTIMVIEIKRPFSIEFHLKQLGSFIQDFSNSIQSIISDFDGRLVDKKEDGFLASFKSVTKAVLCAEKVQAKFKVTSKQIGNESINLKIGLSAGAPVTEKESIFEDIIKLAKRMNNIEKAEIIVSSEVKELYKSENSNQFIDDELVLALSPDEEKFLNRLFEYIEKEWKNTDLKVDDFNKYLGYSRSQLYRKMVFLIGKSPNEFLMSYRLSKALKLLQEQKSNISEVAFDAGFSSPSYFTKCFRNKYQVLPSDFLRSREN